jgi:hypothetical protein
MSTKISELPSLIGVIPSGNSAPISSAGTTYKFTLGTAATLNSGQLLDRANHTGTQAINTISGLESALSGVQVLGPYSILPSVVENKLALICAYSEWNGSSGKTCIDSDQLISIYDTAMDSSTTNDVYYKPFIYESGTPNDETNVSVLAAIQALLTPHSVTVTKTDSGYNTLQNPTVYSNIGVQWSINFSMGTTFPTAIANGVTSGATECLYFIDATTWALAPAWDSGITYSMGNKVTYELAIYESTTNSNLSNTPSSDPMNWTSIMSPIPYYLKTSTNNALPSDFFLFAFNNNAGVEGVSNATITWSVTNHIPALYFGQGGEWKTL